MAGIYFHIPFCKQACHYCDFHFSTSLKYKTELISALKKEVVLQKKFLGDEIIETIYFGGGTPSLLSADEIRYLIDEVLQIHQVATHMEITLEANPDDLDIKKIKQLQLTPINRLSIGIQSFFDEDLFWMNRAHRSKEAEGAVKRAQDGGFENITIDLMYGYPLLSDEKWKQNLRQVFDLQVPHVSAYSMTVEPKTALAAFINKGIYAPVNEAQSAKQFLLLMDKMEQQGFEHYEISNFCKPNQYAKHNANYWKGVKYLGIGPSAHSYNGLLRQWNIANNNKYLQAISKSEIPAEKEILTEKNRVNEYIMTSLRTIWGMDLEKIKSISEEAEAEIRESAQKFFEKGWIKQLENIIILRKEGKLYADQITAELFIE
ncbi:MAG: radical SAM family heme chaperone HemW [Sphingobacteriaceae bacterium]